MYRIDIHNPFDAQVYYSDTVSSTMEVSREFLKSSGAHGTVIAAGFQTAGRGRGTNRTWETEKDSSLLFTILFRWCHAVNIPAALTLRAGLATALGIEDFFPSLAGKIKIKWPNDLVVIAPVTGKIAGILAEAENGNVRLGIGVNVTQTKFPSYLEKKATSIKLCAGNSRSFDSNDRFLLLEKILVRLRESILSDDWIERIESRLFKKDEQVSFAVGAADSGKIVTGLLAGIGPGGELRIQTPEELSFNCGELIY